ncbi:MAG TPA: hypothetical protein DD811_12075 [Syntrophomonas sp.]|jgi:hypothetical protein|nr:hypothetical protein [Syntrophomonas sp.]
MDLYFTLINLTATCISIGCAIFSLRQTRKQTQIMQEQLDESKKPNYPLSMRLESITGALHNINETLKNKDH